MTIKESFAVAGQMIFPPSLDQKPGSVTIVYCIYDHLFHVLQKSRYNFQHVFSQMKVTLLCFI